MEINQKNNSKNIDRLCKIGISIIVSLPLIAVPVWIFPPDWGKTIIFRCVLAIILFLLFYGYVYKNGGKFFGFLKALNPKKNIVFFLLTLLGVIYFLSSIFSNDVLFSFFSSPLRGSGSLSFISYIIFSVVIFLIFKENDWKKIWKLSVFIGVLVALIAVFQEYGLLKSIFIPYEGRPPSVIGGSIFLGTYLLLLSFITLSLFLKEKIRKEKIFYAVSLILFVYVILISGSRAAYLGLFIGGLYFFLLYPLADNEDQKDKKTILLLKGLVLVAVVAGVFAVYYVNSRPYQEVPNALKENKILGEIMPRLSLQLFLADPRFSAWQVGLKAIGDNPILGTGPENFSISFNKHYDPSLPQLGKEWGGWWDKAHNVLLETAITTGIPAMLIYLSIFIVLFWQLQKIKWKEEYKGTQIVIHGIQATLIAYLADNFFTFDTYSSYIVFFLMISYSLYLINRSQSADENAHIKTQFKNSFEKKLVAAALFFFLLFFLWQYNVRPFLINVQINEAEYLVKNNECADAFAKMETVLSKHSYLDSYLRLQYVSFIQECAATNPENSVAYSQKGIELLNEAVKIQPLYLRSWIFLGSFKTIIANAEQNPIKKESLLNEAYSYFEKASELSPGHQEILLEQGKAGIVKGDYSGTKDKAEKCILADSSLSDCYWLRGVSEIYLKDLKSADADIKKAMDLRPDIKSVPWLYQLVNAYDSTKDYEGLASTYQKLIEINPKIAQYHSSLAFVYAKMHKYAEARSEALIFLQLMPDAKEEVNEFLKTLPN